MRKVFITGGRGNIGSYIVKLLKDSYEVTSHDSKPVSNLYENVNEIEGNIFDIDSLVKSMESHDVVMHLAGGFADNDWNSIKNIELNAIGTRNVLEASVRNGIDKFIHASSDSIYGFVFARDMIVPKYLKIDENHPQNPEDNYGLSKLLAEEICRRYTNMYGITTICIRKIFVWNENGYNNYKNILKEYDFNAKRLWAYTDIRDVACSYKFAMESNVKGHEAFMITGNNSFSKETTVELINKYYPELSKYSGLYANDLYGSVYTTEKAKRMIGYAPKYTNRETLIKALSGEYMNALNY